MPRPLSTHLRQRLIVVAGAAGFAGLMAAGYAYNVTLIQLGLPDLATRHAGLDEGQLAASMAVLAGATTITALATGVAMARRGWGASLPAKLRLVAASVATHTALVALTSLVREPVAFWAWLITAALALGIGVPASFGLVVDLVPVRWRGYVAALITALAYSAAAATSGAWSIEGFAALFQAPMAVASLALAGLAVACSRGPLRRLSQQHADPAFGRGRFVRGDGRGFPRRFVVAVAVMFGVYFVDSLGFLRMAATPEIVDGTWQAAESGPRLTIAAAHVVGAALAGILYTELDERSLFPWIFGIFALAQLTYVWDARFLAGSTSEALGLPALYAVGVSLYTVLNFAIWADLSTPRTITVNAAIGVALSAWTATFLSTALAISWGTTLSLDRHLSWVAAVALLALAALFVAWWLLPRSPTVPEPGR